MPLVKYDRFFSNMKSLLLVLMLTGCAFCISGRIQYACHFGNLTVLNVKGRTMEYCKTPLADPRFVRLDDIVYSRPNFPCYECMCSREGFSCCQCTRRPLIQRLRQKQRR